MTLLDRDAVTDDAPPDAFPLDRLSWPDKAHMKTVLQFFDAGGTFKDMMESDAPGARRKFVDMAFQLIPLGSAITLAANGQPTDHPERALAYLDAVAMGEPANIRQGLIQDGTKPDPNDPTKVVPNGGAASSCGMFIRSLLKMIGVQCQNYREVYQFGTCIQAEQELAASFHDGTLVVPTRGDGSRVPKEGDIVHINTGTGAGHVFVAVDTSPLLPRTLQRYKGGPKLDGFSTSAAQGGQQDHWLGGTGDTATNQGYYEVFVDDWTTSYRGHPVDWWIDLEKLVSNACTDGRNFVVPQLTRFTWIVP